MVGAICTQGAYLVDREPVVPVQTSIPSYAERAAMCFSAPSSFAAGTLLCVIGTISIHSARKPTEILFAAIPLIFAVQQICEGLLWLAVADDQFAAVRTSTTYLFLTFALVIWPVWIPLSVRAVEPDVQRHRAITPFLVCGILASIYFAL